MINTMNLLFIYVVYTLALCICAIIVDRQEATMYSARVALLESIAAEPPAIGATVPSSGYIKPELASVIPIRDQSAFVSKYILEYRCITKSEYASIRTFVASESSEKYMKATREGFRNSMETFIWDSIARDPTEHIALVRTPTYRCLNESQFVRFLEEQIEYNKQFIMFMSWVRTIPRIIRTMFTPDREIADQPMADISIPQPFTMTPHNPPASPVHNRLRLNTNSPKRPFLNL